MDRTKGNVFQDLGFSKAEAANLLVRSELMMEIQKIIEREGLTQKDAAKRLGVTQPKVSNLLNGKIDTFTIDKLVNMLARVGRRTDVKVVRDRGGLQVAV